ncbi:hypothetical protein CBL_07465 [Carabus blaptoides fortunei]
MSAQYTNLSSADIRDLVIQNEQNCRLYLNKISTLKETLDKQNNQINELSAESLRREADTTLLDKQVNCLKELIINKTENLKEKRSELSQLQNKVWSERKQFEKNVSNLKYPENNQFNKYSALKNKAKKIELNQELTLLEGQVNALKRYEEYTSRIISDLNSEINELCNKKAHLVDKCLN